MFNALRPTTEISDADVRYGLNRLIRDGIASQTMAVVTSGAFLVAFALSLGASNKFIGLIAAIGPLCQIAQIPAISLVNKVRRRKLLAVACLFPARFSWVLIALTPWLFSPEIAPKIFLFLLFVINGLGAVAGCAWNSWMRDFVPDERRSAFFARRLTLATAVGAAVSLVAAFGLDWVKGFFASPSAPYSVLFMIGSASGLTGTYFLAKTPEPKMETGAAPGLISSLLAPFKDERFLPLLKFLGSWNFAINLAAPFFTVYLLRRLQFSMGWVIGFSVLSQLVNVMFFKIWGRLADRFSNKSSLSVAGTLFVFSIMLWTFTTLPDRHMLTIPLLIAIHVLAGASTAGVALCSGNMALQFAPKGEATAYLAVNGLVNGLAATLAPILAGATADWFDTQRLRLTISWIADQESIDFSAIDLHGLDFLFILAFILGLYALHRLLAIKEVGDVTDKIVVEELISEMRDSVRGVSTVGGMRLFIVAPYQKVKQTMGKMF